MKFNIVLMFVLVLLTAVSGLLCAQTAADMDELLDSREITWGQACRFVLPASGFQEENISAGTAFAMAVQNAWLPAGAEADSPATLGGLSFLIAESFAIQGSILYTLFPGPRYAYRYLAYLGLLPGPQDPALRISGERLVQILGRVLEYRGEGAE